MTRPLDAAMPAFPDASSFSSLSSPPRPSLPLAALRHLGLDAERLRLALASAPATVPGDPPLRLARLVEVHRETLRVHDGRALRTARPWPALRARLQVAQDALVVGDWVWVEAGADEASPDWVTARVPPQGRLSRRDPAGGLQPLVSQIDTALLVMGLDRDFRLARLDRYLVLVHAAGLPAVVVLTKADRCPVTDQRVATVNRHVDGQVPVVAVDGRDAASASAALAPWLGTGRTLALLGSSGAGKSTLVRTLVGGWGDAGTVAAPTADEPARLAMPVAGEVRAGDDRGRHTTTSRSLHPTPCGACLVDTPGLRQLALDVDATAVAEAFEDITVRATACRFRDCTHTGEPGCAVVGEVPPERLRSFHKLLREARRDERDALDRRRERSRWRQQGQAGRERAAEKRRTG